jgi:hypothetical protein
MSHSTADASFVILDITPLRRGLGRLAFGSHRCLAACRQNADVSGSSTRQDISVLRHPLLLWRDQLTRLEFCGEARVTHCFAQQAPCRPVD